MIVNVFTHPIKNPTIGACLQSFFNRFGSHEIRVWMDGSNTTGLADGYIKAVESCEDEYCFMLEHDWAFIRTPEHSLDQISDMMTFPHIRFNKRDNEAVKYDKWLKCNGWYCETPFVSNNPHIIHVPSYREFIKNGWIQRRGRDKGVEEILSKHINGGIYGGQGYPQIITHLRGR